MNRSGGAGSTFPHAGSVGRYRVRGGWQAPHSEFRAVTCDDTAAVPSFRARRTSRQRGLLILVRGSGCEDSTVVTMKALEQACLPIPQTRETLSHRAWRFAA